MTFARNCALANIIATAFTFIHPFIQSINHHPGADKDRIIIIVYIFFSFHSCREKSREIKILRASTERDDSSFRKQTPGMGWK